MPFLLNALASARELRCSSYGGAGLTAPVRLIDWPHKPTDGTVSLPFVKRNLPCAFCMSSRPASLPTVALTGRPQVVPRDYGRSFLGSRTRAMKMTSAQTLHTKAHGKTVS